MRDVLLLLLTDGLIKIMINVVFCSGDKAKFGCMAEGACRLYGLHQGWIANLLHGPLYHRRRHRIRPFYGSFYDPFYSGGLSRRTPVAAHGYSGSHYFYIIGRGCFMDAIALVVLTVPVIDPVVLASDLILYGKVIQ